MGRVQCDERIANVLRTHAASNPFRGRHLHCVDSDSKAMFIDRIIDSSNGQIEWNVVHHDGRHDVCRYLLGGRSWHL